MRRIWPWAVGGVLLAAVWGWVVHGPLAPTPFAPTQAAMPAAPASSTSGPQRAPAASSSASMARPAAAPPAPVPAPTVGASIAASVPPSASASSAPERAEVCGHGLVTQADLERLYPAEVRAETTQRLIAALGRGDDRAQALGWLLAQSHAIDSANAGLRRACGEDMACIQRSQVNNVPAAAAALDSLLALAERSRDPWVYALAASYGCGAPDTRVRTAPAGCARVLPEPWIERSPDDAAPWLWAAALARGRNDEPAVRAALQQAAGKPRVVPTWGMVVEPLQTLPYWQQMKAVEQGLVMIELIGRSAAQSVEVRTALDYCNAPRAGDPQHAATCAGLLRLYSSDEATLVHHSLARRMAMRMGLDADTVRRLEDSRDALMSFSYSPARIGNPDDLLSCKALERALTMLRDTARLGEVGALRKAMAASDMPFEEWARIGREERLKREARQASDAARPPAPR
jgi:hypothetical protein